MTKPRRWVIELRNGAYLQSLGADHGGPLVSAMRFGSRKKADRLIKKHAWIAANGGAPVEAS